MKESKFERLRKELYGEVLQFDNEALKLDFNNKFWELIELCNFFLMESEDNFFALFFVQMKREIRFELTTALATKISGTNFVMYFNPRIFLECTLKEMQALIKHEIYHIMSNHYARAKVLKNKYSELAISIAMDIAINQYIMYLPSWSEKLENVKKTYNVNLKEDLPMEEYVALIQEAIDKLIKKDIDSDQSAKTNHEVWDENSDVDEMDEVIKKLSSNAARGKIPESIDLLIKALNKTPQISWKDYLKRTMGILPAGHKKTITRKDRRQPERLDLRGKLSNRVAQLLVAIDISGSVSDIDIDNIMAEVFSIVKNYPCEITIIECDSEIRRVYKVKTIKDVKAKVDTKGGTQYNPVFNYIYENRLRNHVLIYFTDGLGEEQLTTKPYNYKTIWVLTGKEAEISLKEPWGEVIKLDSDNVKKEVVNVYALVRNEMRDIDRDWAK